MAVDTIRSLLAVGDRRSIGRVKEVLDLVGSQPAQVRRLFLFLYDEEAGVRMRAADALEKLSREQPRLIHPYRAQLLGLLAETTQKEMRWHLAVMVPRLPLTAADCHRAASGLLSYLDDHSSLVRTFALQGLADLTNQCSGLRPRILDLLRANARTGSPAVKARCRILLRDLE